MKRIRIKKIPNKSNLKKFMSGGDIQESSRKGANIEAEKGETAVVPGNDTIPEHYSIGGKKHYQGGTPLNLEKGSFIFSDNKKKLKIKEKEILEEFGIKGKKGKTPAEIAKNFDLNKYKKILLDPNTDKLERETAEKMIKNYNYKLGELALIQESLKGFQNGIPKIAMPYLEASGLGDIITKMGEQGQKVSQFKEQQAQKMSKPAMKNGGQLKEYENGGEDEEKDKGVKIDPKYKSSKYQEGSKDFDINSLKSGDYYKDAKGNWRVVNSTPEKVSYQGEDLGTTFGNNQDVADAYAFLSQTFSNDDFKKLLYDKTISALKNDAYYVGKNGTHSKKYTDEEIGALTKDDVYNHFIAGQKRNYALKANGIDPKYFNDADGSLSEDAPEEVKKEYQSKGINSLNDAFKTFNIPITDEDVKAGNLGLQQATYLGYHDLLSDKENLDPEIQKKLDYFYEPQIGVSDEPTYGSISPIDSKTKNYWTNTSSGQLALVKQPGLKSDIVDVAPEETKIEKNPDPEYKTPTPRDEWWAQDVGNLGNLFGQRMGLKKYLPNSSQIDLENPDVVYYDPSRALADNSEQANIAAKGVSSLAGPNSLHKFLAIQGNANKNAANIVGAYEDKNVAVANQYLNNVAATRNKEHLANSERMKKLYDETTVANQQFDNSKRAANRNLFDAWRQGLTNKKMTQAVNALYPQYETVPSVGGGLYFTEGRPQSISQTPNQNQENQQDAYFNLYRDLKTKNPDLPEGVIKKQADQMFSQQVQPNFSNTEDKKKQDFLKMLTGILK